MQERIEEQKRTASVNSIRDVSIGHHINRKEFVTRLSTSTNQDVVNTLKSQSKRQYYDDLVDKRDSAKNRLTVLEELKKIMNQELEALTYPKHIKFGFTCFIIFAALGVFVPLFYNTWDKTISTVLIMPIENNALVLMLFTIGLTLNFVYIGLELREATLK